MEGMKLATSFTGSRGVRYPSPDVARGFMLLLISLANITFWTGVARVSAPNDAADTAWLWVRTLLIDARSYPLFAMLFGFGLVTMVNRRIASGTQNYLQSLPGVEAGREPTEQEEVWAREQATVGARRLVRRRGLWMVLFGAAHAVLFSGDVIAAYGLVAVIFAGWLARKHWKRAAVLCAVVVVACVVITFVIESFMTSQGAASATDMRAGGGESATTLLSYVSHGVTAWAVNLSTTPISLVVPAMFLGARLADTDFLAHPERHRRLLTGVGLGSLGIGAAGGIGFAQWVTGGSLNLWAVPLHQVAGLAGACGWLALLALYAGGPTSDNRLTGLKRLLSNVGRRSMTAYLSQTVLFILIFVVLGVAGVRSLGVAVSGLIALVVWALIGIGCVIAEALGSSRGPAEWALRWLVAKSARRRTLPAFLPVLAGQSGAPAEAAATSSDAVTAAAVPCAESETPARGSVSEGE